MMYLLFDKALHDEYTYYILTKHFVQHESLFKATDDEHLIEVMPVLFEIENDWKEKIAGEKYIVLKSYLLLESEKKLPDVRIHLQQFIYQKVSGKLFYFRIWDGMVLQKFLPTCTLEQLRMLYKNIESICFEDRILNKQIQFAIENGKVKLIESELNEMILAQVIDHIKESEQHNENDGKRKSRNWNI